MRTFSEWLKATNRDTAFEKLPDEILDTYLCQFFGEVQKQNGQPYSKSAMINLRSGLNRYLQSPPNNRIINLMRNDTFQNANKVFKGKLQLNKQAGHDTSKPHSAIKKADLDKIYQYFADGLAQENYEILQQRCSLTFSIILDVVAKKV